MRRVQYATKRLDRSPPPPFSPHPLRLFPRAECASRTRVTQVRFSAGQFVYLTSRIVNDEISPFRLFTVRRRRFCIFFSYTPVAADVTEMLRNPAGRIRLLTDCLGGVVEDIWDLHGIFFFFFFAKRTRASRIAKDIAILLVIIIWLP